MHFKGTLHYTRHYINVNMLTQFSNKYIWKMSLQNAQCIGQYSLVKFATAFWASSSVSKRHQNDWQLNHKELFLRFTLHVNVIGGKRFNGAHTAAACSWLFNELHRHSSSSGAMVLQSVWLHLEFHCAPWWQLREEQTDSSVPENPLHCYPFNNWDGEKSQTGDWVWIYFHASV